MAHWQKKTLRVASWVLPLLFSLGCSSHADIDGNRHPPADDASVREDSAPVADAARVEDRVTISTYDVVPPADATVPEDAACAAVVQKAELVERPADIIWVIDNSGSMSDEVMAIRQNMNAFAAQLAARRVDARMVLISSPVPGSGYGICVGAPLGSGQCPEDSNLPRYLHVPQEVDSVDSLRQILDTFPRWYQVLRPASVKSFIVVTDDESAVAGQVFIDRVRDLWPKYPHAFDNWSLSGAYCTSTGSTCPNCSAAGTVYEQLRQYTGGLFADLCRINDPPPIVDAGPPDTGLADTGLADTGAGDVRPRDAAIERAADARAPVAPQIADASPDARDAGPSDWTSVFLRLADSITTQTKLTCDWGIPPHDAGQLDPARVNVQFTPSGGRAATIGKVPAGAECGAVGGWRYDDEAAPTRIRLCPSTCAIVQADPAASIQILFGCRTIVGGGIDIH